MMHAAKTHAWWISETCFRDISYVRHKQPPSRLTQVTFNSENQLYIFKVAISVVLGFRYRLT